MNSRERFMTALRRQEPDRVPIYEFHWNPGFIEALLGRKAYLHSVDDQIDMARLTGSDCIWCPAYGFTALFNVQTPGLQPDQPPKSYQDLWGTQYGTNEHAWPAGWPEVYAVESREDWAKLREPDIGGPETTAQARRAKELAGEEFAILGGVRGPFAGAWMLTGLVNISMFLYEDPDLLQDILWKIGRWNTALGLRLIHEAHVDAVVVNDDYGMNNKLFIRPDDWRRFVLPVIAEQVEALAGTGTPVILHSDGNLNAILDDIAGLGLAGLHPWQRTANMDIRAGKQKYGERLCLLGNLSVTTTLPYGTPDDVALETLECLKVAAPGGGYILSADHSFHGGVPHPNIWRALDTVKQFGAYPLDMEAIESEYSRLAQLKVERAVAEGAS